MQRIHFNVLEGGLVIDYVLLGKLPTMYSEHETFQHLFGERVFWIWPSSLPGITYMAASLVEQHSVHFGMRNGSLVTRLILPDVRTVYEHVPRSMFLATNSAPDLPLPLIEGSVHLVNLSTLMMEIRPEKEMWKYKQRNWILNIRAREVVRRSREQFVGSRLVDPKSSLFQLHRFSTGAI